MNTLIRAVRAGLMSMCLVAGAANASVLIAGTRVVFPAQDGEVTVRLTNDNAHPALVEAWIDNGDPKSTPDKVNVPFLITPPLFRMEAHKDQSLRIISTPTQLPSDRESLFWLNVLEIPPKPSGEEAAGKNLLQFAIRSRLKLFYRPAHLPGDAQKAPEQVTWKAVADGQGYALEVRNPTPYHVTIVKLSLDVGGKSYSADTGMVDPLGVLHLKVKGLTATPAAGTSVAYDIVNDYGATASFKGSVSP
ncbi:fimbria-related chaperone [Dyella lipolytica]|uniref:Fimbria/pilus periplasmic chaperone n=1 Tax=Dyella lipolytica TaxID=1867835 RepID=A0ABW8IY67_9GAMM|nr:fimbria/pilus periplasmic chaperone [Dyella lipolytica]GLQ48192.1 fimbria-related chaperone [Dyella lipolytica]